MRTKLMLMLLLAAAVLAGCAVLSQMGSEVSTFGEWPVGRKPGSYAFERLPSQQARPADSDALEAAAAPALQKAGFTPVAAGQQPDVLVQVAARASPAGIQPWDDPLWWRGGFGTWRYGPWLSPRWGLSVRHDFARYEREVGLLIRDRASGKPLFEARASNEGHQQASAAVASVMFEAALTDFPRQGINPRSVLVPLPR